MSADSAGNADSPTNDPLRRLIDLMIYAPIGLLTLAKAELPQLIATGKTRIDNQLTQPWVKNHVFTDDAFLGTFMKYHRVNFAPKSH